MSRSGYTDECYDTWAHIRWRGAVASAIRGKRGQAFLKEMLAALDALPEKRLIAGELVDDCGQVCALGSVAVARGLDVREVDPDEPDQVASAFRIAEALAREIEYVNDVQWMYYAPGFDADAARYKRVRQWVEHHIRD